MATTHFVDKETVIEPEWANEVDALVHDVFEAATTKAEARTKLELKSAATKDVGTASDEIPQNSDLGTASKKDAGAPIGVTPLKKPDSSKPCIKKTGAQTLSVRAGTSVRLDDGTIISFDSDTAITMPSLTAGTDYSVWVNPDGTASAHEETDYSSASVISAPTSGAKCIGGFHYGLVDPDETVSGGSFAESGTGWIWSQDDVDDIRGINKYSIWDLHWRKSTNMQGQRGFAYSPRKRAWGAIYFCSTDPDANGLSRAGTDIASGTNPCKIPKAVGGDGTKVYDSSSQWGGFNWFAAQEVASAYDSRLPWEHEAHAFFLGVTEEQSIGGSSSTYPTTERNAGYTSVIGIEQASGHHYAWGMDSAIRPDKGDTGAWHEVTGGRGSIYTFGTDGEALVRVRLGGNRTRGSHSGSACALWHIWPWNVHWSAGLRAAGDHLERAA